MNKYIFFVVLIASSIYGSLNPGDAFRAFFWTMDSANDTAKSGCYGYNQIDSIIPSQNSNKLLSSFWLTYDWWHLRFKMSYMPAEITLSDSIPVNISRSSNHFRDVKWFTSFKRTGSTDSITFYFPLLPQGQAYGRYDYFTIDVDSLLDLEFYGAGDSIMVGTFVHKEPAANGAVNILGRNVFIVELTQSNPFRISSVRCSGAFDSLLSIFLKFPLDSLKEDAAWYGVDILDTLTDVPKIVVSSVGIAGKEPFLLGSKKDITWKLAGTSEIDSCLITVSYDKMNWVPLGTTAIDTVFNWSIPDFASDSTIIRVIACGKHGERIAGTRDNIQFILSYIWGIQIH